MNTTVNPQRFQAQEISLAPLARGQSAVTLGGLRIGRISHAVASDGKASWLWSLTGPSCSSLPEDLRICGEAAALADAKVQLRHAFDSWLGWATAQPGPVQWHWTEAACEKPSRSNESEMPLAG